MSALTHSPDVETEPGYDVAADPICDVRVWELTDKERVIYELGFHMGYGSRQPELDQLDHEADRLYLAAFDHRDCTCWKRGVHRVRW